MLISVMRRGYSKRELRSVCIQSEWSRLTIEQEAQNAEEQLRKCLSELEKYQDPFDTPVNIDGCGGVMDAVSTPFTQEYVSQFTKDQRQY